MAAKTINYKLTKPAQTDFYNVKDFNDNMDIVDKELKNNFDKLTGFPVYTTETKILDLSSTGCKKGTHIIVAEKGHYCNGSAIILVEGAGSLKHHSLVLAVSSSFPDDSRTINCLGNSAYATQLFSKASVETVWAAESHKVYLTLATDIPASDGCIIKVTVVSAAWRSCVKLLDANSTETEKTKTILLEKGKTSFDVNLSDYLPIDGGTVKGELVVDSYLQSNDKVHSRAVELYGKSVDSETVKQGGYIDFHYGVKIAPNQTAGALNDYSARIIENAPGEIDIQANSEYTPKLRVGGQTVYDNSRIKVQSTDVTEGSALQSGNIILVYEE